VAHDEDDFEIGALLSAPIRAIQEAQIEAERQYVQFLFDFGLQEKVTGSGKTRKSTYELQQLEFDMDRSIADPTSPDQVVMTKATVRAPLISMIQMPAIGIEEATIDVALEVSLDKQATEEFETKTSTKPSTSTARKRPALLEKRSARTAVLRGSVSAGKSTRNFRSHGKLNVKLKLRASHDDDSHGRLARIISEGVSTIIETSDK
jgi:hypothetical protein